MPIVRAPRVESNFYVLDKSISEDSRISWAARGLLIFLLGKPDYWRVNIQALVNAGPDKKGNGQEAIYGYLKELISAGYVARERLSTGEMDYFVSERCAVPSEPHQGNPDLGNPDQGKTALVSNEEKQVLNERKPSLKKLQLPEDFSVSQRVKDWAAEKGHDRLELRLEHFVGYAKASGAKYTDWDQAFMNAIRDNWAKLPVVSQEAKSRFRGVK